MAGVRVVVACCLASASAQQTGRVWPEAHPPLPLTTCTSSGGCDSVEQTAVTLDASRRWLHDARWTRTSPVGRYGNCGGQHNWNATLCPDPLTCAANCALEGLRISDYREQYGVFSKDGGLHMSYVTAENNIGSRLFLLEGGKSGYRVFHLKNREFTFSIDVSTLECGMNAALYFVEMPAHGGEGLGNNNAGAAHGLGYCDARCPHEVLFIQGEANLEGSSGACCVEMDVFEGNKVASSMTAHPCNTAGLAKCSGIECGDSDKHEYYRGICDKDGCEFNPFRLGSKAFFGPNATVNTLKPITVVTQFLTEDHRGARWILGASHGSEDDLPPLVVWVSLGPARFQESTMVRPLLA